MTAPVDAMVFRDLRMVRSGKGGVCSCDEGFVIAIVAHRIRQVVDVATDGEIPRTIWYCPGLVVTNSAGPCMRTRCFAPACW
jgi:hypothetical protein